MGLQTAGFVLADADPDLVGRFRTILTQHARVAIGGGPRTGKSTLAEEARDRPVLHSDDFKQFPWDEVPHRIIAATRFLPRFVVEGVMVGRAIRRGLEVDALVWLRTPRVERSPGQEAMAKGCETIMGSATFEGARYDLS